MLRARAFFLSIVACAVACGARSAFESRDAPDAAPPFAPPIGPAAGVDGSSPVAADAGSPPRPCHFVAAGERFRAVSFDDPAFSFHQDGLLLRGQSWRVVQYGNVAGMRTGAWDDPPIYAAEYDVSSWPPTVVHGPTELYQSMHDPADLLDFPNGRLGLVFWFDNDGLGPRGIRYRTLDATSWRLDEPKFLVEDGAVWSAPVLGARGDEIVTTYRRPVYTDGGTATSAVVRTFGVDGAPRNDPQLVWSNGESAYGLDLPTEAVTRTGTDTLIAVAWKACDSGTVSPFCEARSTVILRLVAGGLEKAGSVPARDPRRAPESPHLLTDGAGHTWLTFWEADLPSDGGFSTARSLYATPLTSAGAPAGPVESWYADDSREPYEYYPLRGASIGALGVVYPVSRVLAGDAGPSAREVHLVHRQLDAADPVEDIVFATAYTSFSVAAVQLGEVRTLVVGYNTYETGGVRGHGVLARYVCREDAK